MVQPHKKWLVKLVLYGILRAQGFRKFDFTDFHVPSCVAVKIVLKIRWDEAYI